MTEEKIQSVARYPSGLTEKKGKSLSPLSTNWNLIPSDAHENMIFANS